MKYCKNCVYPIVGVNLEFNEEGICSSCRTSIKFNKFTPEFWEKRKKKFDELIKEVIKNNSSNYDVLIPVSGGKDSYYQTHVITELYGLKPLLMTYHGNNYLPEGNFNRDKMRENFDADHIVWGPSVKILKKLNLMGFRKMGDMNWHNHCGINTAPISIATKFKIPLIIWGEISWDISGMFDPEDFVEFSARVRHEHDLRGFEWYDFVDEKEGITEKDMIWSKYPSDEEILEVGTRGVYIGNFFKWEPNKHVKLVEKKYGWKRAEKPFERTYRDFSNLDDRYENGVHDLMKFVKFGYGRCSDHASKDIRLGDMTREQGIEMVKKYDHVVSSDLKYWCDYVNISEDEFWNTADTFRDPNIWRIEQDNKWYKHTVWDSYESFGEVNLTKEQKEKHKQKQPKVEK